MMSQTQSQSSGPLLLDGYQTEGFFDELLDGGGHARPESQALVELLNALPSGELVHRQKMIERSLYRMGITFTVYSDSAGTEKIMPFDVIPRSKIN